MYNTLAQALSFDVTDIEGSVLLGCAGILALRLILLVDNLGRKLLSAVKIIIGQTDRYDVFTFSRWSQETGTSQQDSVHKPQPNLHHSSIVQMKKDLINMYPN